MLEPRILNPLGGLRIDERIRNGQSKDFRIPFGGDGIRPGFRNYDRDSVTMGDFDLRQRNRAVGLTSDRDDLIESHKPFHYARAFLGLPACITDHQFDFFTKKSPGRIDLFSCHFCAIHQGLSGLDAPGCGKRSHNTDFYDILRLR